MSQPLQFPMRRALVAVALFCIAAALFWKGGRYYHDVVMEVGTGRLTYDMICGAGFVAIGAGIGTLVRRPFACVAVVIVVELIGSLFPVVY